MENFVQKIEINCDMGEGFGKWKMVRVLVKISNYGYNLTTSSQGPDEELMKYIDVANIACGFHAGDPTIMMKSVRLAKQHGIKAGAHPGLQGIHSH